MNLIKLGHCGEERKTKKKKEEGEGEGCDTMQGKKDGI